MPGKVTHQPEKRPEAKAQQQLKKLANSNGLAQLQSAGSGVIQLYSPQANEVGQIFEIKLPKRMGTVMAVYLRPAFFDTYIFKWHGEEVRVTGLNIIGLRQTSELRPASHSPSSNYQVEDEDEEEENDGLMPMDEVDYSDSSFSPQASYSGPQSSSNFSPSSFPAPQYPLPSPMLSSAPSFSLPGPQSSSKFSPSSFPAPQYPLPSSMLSSAPSFSLTGPQSSSNFSPSSFPAPQYPLPSPMLSSAPSSFLPALAGPPQPSPDKVISGHGRFNESYLLPQDPGKKRSPKKATFKVPDNITLIMYAPNGAALDNAVANAIEQGNYPKAELLEMKQSDGSKVVPVPTPYPYIYGPGREAINYTVMPPDRLLLAGNPIVVDGAKSLFDIVSEIQEEVTVHYACCSAGFSDKVEFRDLFPDKGFHVRFQH